MFRGVGDMQSENSGWSTFDVFADLHDEIRPMKTKRSWKPPRQGRLLIICSRKLPVVPFYKGHVRATPPLRAHVNLHPKNGATEGEGEDLNDDPRPAGEARLTMTTS